MGGAVIGGTLGRGSKVEQSLEDSVAVVWDLPLQPFSPRRKRMLGAMKKGAIIGSSVGAGFGAVGGGIKGALAGSGALSPKTLLHIYPVVFSGWVKGRLTAPCVSMEKLNG